MLPLSPPLVLPDAFGRRASAQMLADSSGKGLYGDFRSPDQAFVWGEPKVPTFRQARRHFQADGLVGSMFWIVPKADVESALMVLRATVYDLHAQIPAAGLVGVWESPEGIAEEGEPDEVLVGWIGTADWLSGLFAALEHTGWAFADAGIREVVFDPLSKKGRSPMDIDALGEGRELSCHEQQVVWSALSSRAEKKLYVGFGGRISSEILLVFFVLFSMIFVAFLIYPGIKEKNLLCAETTYLEALARNVQQVAKKTATTEARAVEQALLKDQGRRVYPIEMAMVPGNSQRRLSVWGTPVWVRPSPDGVGFEVVYSNLSPGSCVGLVDGSIETFKTAEVSAGRHSYKVLSNGKINPDLLAKGCSASESTVVFSNARNRRGLRAQ